MDKLSMETEHKCVENYAPTCIQPLLWQATRRKDIEGRGGVQSRGREASDAAYVLQQTA